jgi:hypothetical protein
MTPGIVPSVDVPSVRRRGWTVRLTKTATAAAVAAVTRTSFFTAPN